MMGKTDGRRRRGRHPTSHAGWQEMVGCHHWLSEHEFEQIPGVGDGQGGLVCCSPWGCKVRTRLSDWTELIKKAFLSFLPIHGNSTVSWVYIPLSLLPFAPLLFSAIARPPQTTTLPSWISFSSGWFLSPPPVLRYKPPSLILQAFCLPDLIFWIYSSHLIYIHMGFDLGHTWLV